MEVPPTIKLKGATLTLVDGMKDKTTRQERIRLLDTLEDHGIEHFGRPLREHLIGTHDLLERWGCTPDVCLAGLFHSVYGTKTFQSVSLAKSERNRLRKLIGGHAETLVYIFCLSDRRKLLLDNRAEPFYWVNHVSGEKTDLTRETLEELVELEAANYVEQLPFGTVKSDLVFHDMRTRFVTAKPLMSATTTGAVQHAIEAHAHLFSAYPGEGS